MKKEERAIIARSHHEEMMRYHSDLIHECIDQTVVYGGDNKIPSPITNQGSPEHLVSENDVVSEALSQAPSDYHICILNFADNSHPGGLFLLGAGAQEESLCHESVLFEVLFSPELSGYYAWNREHKNHALYQDRALFTPNVLIKRGEREMRASILTCAAPNFKLARRYKMATEEENMEALKSRIQFMANILEENRVEVFLGGAWGCGVFGQDPETVAELFLNAKWGEHMQKIIHPVIGSKNYEAFKKMIMKKDA